MRVQHIVASAAVFGCGYVAFGAPATTFAATVSSTTTEVAGGGTIVSSTLGNASSPTAAAGAMLSRIHMLLGSRPTVVQAVRDAARHTVTLLFTDVRGGKPYTGIAMVNAMPGSQASGVAVLDVSARFPKTVKPLLRQVSSGTAPSTGAPSIKLDPAEPLIPHPFPDGSGSIAAPPNWTIRKAGGGSAAITGPHPGEVVLINTVEGFDDPSYGIGAQIVRGIGIGAMPQIRQENMQHVAMLPYDPDPVKAWQSWPLATAKQAGVPGETYRAVRVNKIGDRLVEIIGSGSGDGKPPVTFIAYVYTLPADMKGSWAMGSTFTLVPTSLWKKDGLTAVAILNSARLNTQVFDRQNAQIRNAFQQQFDAEIAADRSADVARRERTDEFLANDAVAQDNMHKDAVAMQNYVLDQSVVVNTSTGEHLTASNDFADSIVRNDANYRIVRPSELLQGVDY
jgi:hypothetical protein